jgi:peptidoglycan/LPS O-acetylase OafA/YrhL
MQNRTYFKGINGLRALAAISVVIFHLNMSFKLFGLPVLRTIDLAGFGVSIFFAISGFLITYLLLKEMETGQIDIKKFYIRRALRIWPLYFLILVLSLLTNWLYNIAPVTDSIFYYLFFAANIPFILDITLPFLGHYWSVGVEEQFYIFWPWLIRKSRKIIRTITVFTIIWFLLRLITRFIDYKYGYALPYAIIHVTRFDCMAIGAIGATLLYQKNSFFIKLSTHIFTQIISWLVIFLLMFNTFHIASVIDQEIVSIVTVFLIVNLSSNPNTIISLDYPVFDFLGKISYGIYIIHQLVIFFFAKFLVNINLSEDIKYIVAYVGVLGLTILLSFLSYEFFEKYFLILKEKFSIVKSSISKKGI